MSFPGPGSGASSFCSPVSKHFRHFPLTILRKSDRIPHVYGIDAEEYAERPAKRAPGRWKGERDARRIHRGAGTPTVFSRLSRRVPGAPVTARECIGTPRGRFPRGGGEPEVVPRKHFALCPDRDGGFNFAPFGKFLIAEQERLPCRFTKNWLPGDSLPR